MTLFGCNLGYVNGNPNADSGGGGGGGTDTGQFGWDNDLVSLPSLTFEASLSSGITEAQMLAGCLWQRERSSLTFKPCSRRARLLARSG